MLAFKHYKHRSDSDTDDSEDEGACNVPRRKVTSQPSTPWKNACSQPSTTDAPSQPFNNWWAWQWSKWWTVNKWLCRYTYHILPDLSQVAVSKQCRRQVMLLNYTIINNITRKSSNQEKSHPGTCDSNGNKSTQDSTPYGNQDERDLLVASTSLPKHDLPNPSTNSGSKGQACGHVDGSGSTSGCSCVILWYCIHLLQVPHVNVFVSVFITVNLSWCMHTWQHI